MGEEKEKRRMSDMPKATDLEELLEMIDKKKIAEFRKCVSRIPSVDIAELFEVMPSEYQVIFYRLLSKEAAAEAFIEMSSELKEHLINSFTDSELSATLEELYIDDTVDMIEEMPASVVKRILRNSKNENRSVINRLLRYPKNTAGAIMTTEYVRFTTEMTVEHALAHIRAVAIDKETVYTCYVTDKERHLIGIVTARELLTSRLDAKLGEFMEKNVIFVSTIEDKEEVANKFDKYGFLALPVVDRELRLVGIITFDDAIDVMRDEAEEDFAKMAAITPSEKTYLKTSVHSIFRSRIPWLLLLMISATFSSAILGRFESRLPAVLLLFVPMLMDTGGNCGAQASVTVIRAISLNEARLSDFARILWKEARVGLACGAVLGIVAFAKVFLIDRLAMKNSEVTLNVTLSVSFAVFITVLVAKFIGSMLPLFAKRIGLDPAVMASPLITTLVDAVSLLLYFFICSRLLPI